MRGGHNRQKPAGDGAKRPPPKGGQFSTGWYSQVPNSKQSGMASRFTKRCTVAKVNRLHARPVEKGETGETLDNPSLVSVLLCTKLEMSDINKGN